MSTKMEMFEIIAGSTIIYNGPAAMIHNNFNFRVTTSFKKEDRNKIQKHYEQIFDPPGIICIDDNDVYLESFVNTVFRMVIEIASTSNKKI